MLTHFLTSQPALIKLDNENIGGHLTPLHRFLVDVLIICVILLKTVCHCLACLLFGSLGTVIVGFLSFANSASSICMSWIIREVFCKLKEWL